MSIRHHAAWTALRPANLARDFTQGTTRKVFSHYKSWFALFKLLTDASHVRHENIWALSPMRYYFCLTLPCIVISSIAYGAESAPAPQPNTLYYCKVNGQDVYTNTKLNNKCKGVVLSYARPPIQSPAPSPAPSAQTPSNFPKVTETAQKTRDADRKHILEQEMVAEEKNLERAKKDLSLQESKAPPEERYRKDFTERIQPYKEKVAQHERNIQALRKEMGNLK